MWTPALGRLEKKMENEIVTVENLPKLIAGTTEKRYLSKISKISKSISNSFKIENNRFLYFLNQVPIISHALKYEKGFTAIIPDEFKEGLKNGTLKILQGKDGASISTIVDSSGKIVHQMRLKEFTKLINPAELSQAMNQICMQMQLDEIQKNLSEFRLEANSKLNEILRNLHDNRIAAAESLKLSFKRFQSGEEITKSQLLIKIDEVKALLLKEIKSQIDSLSIYKKEKQLINTKKNEEIQTKISFILEAINSLQDVFLIECYLNNENEDQIYKITNTYTQDLVNLLNINNLKLLDGLSDFSFLQLKNNIWEEKLIPEINQLTLQYDSSRKFLTGDSKK